MLYDDIPIVDVALAEHGDHSRADNASRSWLTATLVITVIKSFIPGIEMSQYRVASFAQSASQQ